MAASSPAPVKVVLLDIGTHPFPTSSELPYFLFQHLQMEEHRPSCQRRMHFLH